MSVNWQSADASLRRWLMVAFFFRAEDGIRDGHVTGVQTCALPIWDPSAIFHLDTVENRRRIPSRRSPVWSDVRDIRSGHRSEERRVGKECRSPRSAARSIKKKNCTTSILKQA